MLPEIAALAEDSRLLALLVIGAFFGAAINRLWRRLRWPRRRKSWRPSIAPRAERPASAPEPLDAADQLRVVMDASFTVQPLLNRSEARVFKELHRTVSALDPSWQVMAQVSLGEILRCKDSEAFSCINAKRVDLLLVDADCMPRHAIEYQGKAHYRGGAAARDAVKKEALRRAGIGYHEVVAGQTTPAELRRLVERLIAEKSRMDA